MPERCSDFRTIFLSDVHLGSAGCQAGMLLDFLVRIRPESLFLVGDIMDMESLSRRFYWPQAHNEVLLAILDHAHRGTRVVYVPGNHDIQARDYGGLKFGNVEILRETVHETAAGRRLLVMHGDALDRHLRQDAWLHRLGSLTYRQLVRLNSRVNRWRLGAGLSYWPLASSLKHRSRAAQIYMSRFRDAAVAHTRKGGFDGCIMGHIHRPEIATLDGVTYMNCGDWVEHCTALAEHADGRFQLLDWAAMSSHTGIRPGLPADALPRAA